MSRTLALTVLSFLCLAGNPLGGQTPTTFFDVVVANGRVIDPESGLDAIRHIGIRGDRIVAVSGQPFQPQQFQGGDLIDAAGLVVSPGFIDLHRHAVGDNAYRYAARDGVTSAFELEIGAPDVNAWYRLMGPARLINFGVSAGHIGARMHVLGDKGLLLPTGPGRGEANAAQVAEIARMVDDGLGAGAVAVGMAIGYAPGATPDEVAAVVRTATKQGAFIHAHLGGGAASISRFLGLAGDSGAAVHIAHINSLGGSNIASYLEAIRAARASKIDVTTELYPYTAGATLIQSATYDSWEKWPEERFAELQWAATGERLTKQTFAKYRAHGGSVISHSNTEENLLISIRDPLPMIASDGGRDLDDNPTHPRASGTFARVLGHYVREVRALTLQDALRRMTIEPARRLESRVPEMKDRGCIRVGAYADITVFDPATVADRSTYVKAAEFSHGIQFVIVNGVPVVRGGALDTHGMLQGQKVLVGVRTPGRPIRAPRR